MAGRIRRNRRFVTREWFTAYDLARDLNIDNKADVQQVLRSMMDNGEVIRSETWKGSMPVVKWQRRGIHWTITKPWRSTIPPMVYGCPTWSFPRDH